MISDIAFEQIEGNYWYGAYGEFRVVMMKDNGYINATKLCRDGNKDFCDWSRLKGSYELIKAVEEQMVLENTHANLMNSDLALEDYRSADVKNGNLAITKINSGNKTEINR